MRLQTALNLVPLSQYILGISNKKEKKKKIINKVKNTVISSLVTVKELLCTATWQFSSLCQTSRISSPMLTLKSSTGLSCTNNLCSAGVAKSDSVEKKKMDHALKMCFNPHRWNMFLGISSCYFFFLVLFPSASSSKRPEDESFYSLSSSLSPVKLSPGCVNNY